jgi:hypothetical protein
MLNRNDAIAVDIPHNVLRHERDVTLRETRLRNPGGCALALRWIVENDRTGVAEDFSSLRQAESFFERELAKAPRNRGPKPGGVSHSAD